MEFSEEIIQTYPYPLATAAKRVNDATECVEEYLCLANLFEVTLKYLASISLSQYLRDDAEDEGIQRQIKKLSRPSLGVWNEILRASVHFYAGHPERIFAVPELRDGYTTKLRKRDPGTEGILAWFHTMAEHLEDETKMGWDRISLQNLLDLMVHYRNETWGHGIRQLIPEFCEEHAEYFLPGLQGMLEWLAFMTQYPLRYVKEVRKIKGQDVHIMFDYMGASWHQGDVYVGEYFMEERLYLCDDQGVPQLSVHPLFVVSQRRLYVLEYHEQEKSVGYSDCETGESFEPDKERLSSYAFSRLVDDRHNKLKDTELELPIPPQKDGLDVDETSLMPSLADLLAQLSAKGRQTLEIALGEALRIGHFWLGIEFLLMGLSKQDARPLSDLLHELGASRGEFRGALRGMVRVVTKEDWRRMDVAELGAQAFDELQPADRDTLPASFTELPEGEKHPPVVTPRMMQVLRDAANLAGEEQIGHVHLLLAALRHPHSLPVNLLLGLAVQASWEPTDVPAWVAQQTGVEPLKFDQEAEPPTDSPRVRLARPDGAEPPPLKVRGVLTRYGRDLTDLAQRGELRPAVGESAHKAMVQMGLILQQTQANNPILLGDPGVGKTAIVEGFAYRLATDPKVVSQLAGKRIVDLPPAALLAGTKYRGDLEERLQKLVAEMRASGGSTVVFIDELHTILGGRAEGGLGAIADALKPALARGEFPCIGATTVGEYRRHIESDPALARRFTPVWIEEPTVEEAVEIVGEVARARLGPDHGVRYPQAAIEEAVRLSVRYLHDEFLPGKAIKLLDQAGPRVVMGGSLSGRKDVDADKRHPQDQPVSDVVTVEIVREIVSERTGVPLTRLSEDESQKLLDLEDRLRERVKGQDEAVREIARVVKRARAGLADPRRPPGVFLFAGPTGVGKTELGLALAEALFDEEDAILRLDMSEYMEKHQISRLIGSPPGYVGYQEEGQLTGRLRRRPYSVVLLDEVEKAHDDVQHLFLQLFDAGRLTDARGNLADGRNAIFVMTTNLGAKEALGLIDQRKTYQEKLQAAIEDHFTPEFLNRIDRIVYFEPLTPELLLEIFDKLFKPVAERFLAQGIQVEVTEQFKQYLCQKYTSKERGARPLERAIEDEIVAPLTDKLLAGEIERGRKFVVGEDVESAVSEIPLPSRFEEPVEGPSPPQPLDQMDRGDREELKAQNEEMFDQELAAMAARLREQEIEIEIDEAAKDFLCDPFWTETTLDRALAQLVEEPLVHKLEAGEFHPGDHVQVNKYADHLEFKRAEGGEG